MDDRRSQLESRSQTRSVIGAAQSLLETRSQLSVTRSQLETRSTTRRDTLRGSIFEDDPSEFDTTFKIVMIRSGEVEWEDNEIYCGWYDSKLTMSGKEKLAKASNSLKVDNYTFDLAFTSTLKRCEESLSVILNELELQDIEIIARWELNERHCGTLTGHSQDELVSKYGVDQLNFWMTNYFQAPPPITKSHKYYEFIYDNPLLSKDEKYPFTESIESIHKRVINFWKKQVCPHILSGRKILLVTHNACLLALVQYLDDIDYHDFKDTEIPRSVPFYYKLDETLRPVLKDSYISMLVNICYNINGPICLFSVLVTNELERKIFEAFDVFDHANNRTVDIREIGTVIRALGCVPSEEELAEILEQIENPESRGKVNLSKFIHYMSNVFTEHKYMPATPDRLLEAFHALDPEGLGYVTREFLTKIITEEGEPFTQDDVEEMMATAVDPTTDTIPYEYYINQIMFDPPGEDNLYVLADRLEAERPKEKQRTMTEILRVAQQLEEEEAKS